VWSSRSGRCLRFVFYGLLGIVFGDAAVFAGTGYCGGIDAAFGQDFCGSR
jgi:hypothetical protein